MSVNLLMEMGVFITTLGLHVTLPKSIIKILQEDPEYLPSTKSSHLIHELQQVLGNEGIIQPCNQP